MPKIHFARKNDVTRVKPARKRRAKPKGKVPKATKAYVQSALKDEKETNWVLIDTSAQPAGYDAPLLVHWSAVPQGAASTVNTREGDRIQPTKMNFSYQVDYFSNLRYNCRVVILQWKPDNVIDVPTVAKIFNIVGTEYSIYSPYVQTQVLRSKFKILYDVLHTNENSEANAGYPYKADITKFSGKYINYNAGATSGKNQIYFCCFSNTTAGDPFAPAIKKAYILNWKDTV